MVTFTIGTAVARVDAGRRRRRPWSTPTEVGAGGAALSGAAAVGDRRGSV